MLEYGLRFLAGGIAVSAFATLATACALKASRACSALLLDCPRDASYHLVAKRRSVRGLGRPLNDYRGLRALRLQLDNVRVAQEIPAVLVDRDDRSSGCWFAVALGASAVLLQRS